ncbi:tRNA (guanosine(46)-N7)-methyltransferase TrmB [Cellulomonas sp. KRMCY2]|uniref:tRNA (guanosine(46)-N7)-methyltransferase TrmB n=1 Tax=Cellulomonas sp. KRMCY2 TaxID=1304865 RepID=UPI00045EADE3|nr:tRNA (guanosine(46)-N7)-methyltransferase TrmB [Cellulomonas sp. KRMCY2]
MTAPRHRFEHLPASAHEEIRTFHPRRSPLGPARLDALETLWPRLGFSVHDEATGPAPLTADGLLDTVTLFGRRAPLVLEVGSGMGETVVAMAVADPVRDYLAVEAHLPGIAHLLGLIDRRGLTNLRVAHGDALELVRRRIAPGGLDAVHVFFPDPWPKAKHHKRRLIAPAHVALLRSRLRPGGTLHCATDWAPYAVAMLETLAADPELVNTHAGYAPRPAHRPVTKFERRGLALGHEIADLVFVRVG